MKECFKCGISEELANMHDVITPEGIKPICSRCLRDENLPIVKRPTSEQVEESKKQETVKDKIQKASGRKIGRIDMGSSTNQRSLRDVVEDKLGKDYFKIPKTREDLIANFHWKIMNARRKKKLTSGELGKKINESVETIKKAERGYLPQNEKEFIRKLEQVLGVYLFKQRENENYEKSLKENKETITIGDVKKVYEKDKIPKVENNSKKSALIQSFKKRFKINQPEEKLDKGEINKEELREKIQETMEKRGREPYSEEEQEKLEKEIRKSLQKSGERIWKKPEEIKKENKGNLTDKEINDILFKK